MIMREMSSRETDRACPLFLPSHRLDEIRLYSRALTNDEILELYTGVNSEPVVDAGEDVDIEGEDVEDSLQYRWTEGEAILLDWTIVENGECPLSLGSLGLALGTHTFTLQVNDSINPIQSKSVIANACDNSGGTVTLSAIISSSEPSSDLWPNDLFPDWTLPMIDQEAGTIDLSLRAECSPKCSVRTYTITITAEDEAGNQSSSTLEIIAPHDKRKN